MTASPILIVPDTTPLIHLAAGGLLDVLLPALGRVVVPDVVALEATRVPEKPWAREAAAWLAKGVAAVPETEMGDAYRTAIELGRRPPRHAGEIAILEWLWEDLTRVDDDAIVVFEDKRIPRMLRNEGLAERATALSTAAVLALAERNGILKSALDAQALILSRVPTAATTMSGKTSS